MKAPSFRTTLLAALLLTPATVVHAQGARSAPVPTASAAEGDDHFSSGSADSITREIEQRVLVKQYQTAAEALVELAQAAGDDSNEAAEKARIQTSIAKYTAWLTSLSEQMKKTGGDPDEILDEVSSQAGALNETAWQLITGEDESSRQPAVALQLADAAIGLISPDDHELRPRFLDTRARALFTAGRHEDAVAAQTQAIAACDDDDLKQAFQKTLDAYRKGELPAPGDDTGSMPDVEAPAQEIDFGGIDPGELNQIAWNVLTGPGDNGTSPNPAAALQLGTIALGLCGDQSGDTPIQILDTCARSLFQLGSHAEAITLQKKAVDLCKEDGEQKQDLQNTLEAYEKGKLPEAANPGESISSENIATLNEYAWNIVTSDDQSADRRELALKLANVGIAICPKGSTVLPMIIDTQARAFFVLDKKKEAIAAEQRAIAASVVDSDLRKILTATLASYRAGQLPQPGAGVGDSTEQAEPDATGESVEPSGR